MSSQLKDAKSHFPPKEYFMQERITCSSLELLAHLPYQKVAFCFLRHGYMKVAWVLGDPLQASQFKEDVIFPPGSLNQARAKVCAAALYPNTPPLELQTL